MLTDREREYLRTFAFKEYAGEGAIITYRLREYFQPIYDIRYSESLCFKYVKQIPESLLQAECELSSFSNDEIDAAFDYAKGLAAKRNRPLLRWLSSAAIWRKATTLGSTGLFSSCQTSLVEQ
jgi:hypothetical protein